MAAEKAGTAAAAAEAEEALLGFTVTLCKQMHLMAEIPLGKWPRAIPGMLCGARE